MKGFIATVLVAAMALLLVGLLGVLSSAKTELQSAPLRYPSMASADVLFLEVGEDLHDIVAADIRVWENNGTVYMHFQDTFPPENRTSELTAYAASLNATAARMHANATLNISGLTDGRMEIIFFDDNGQEEDGYIYWKNYTGNQTLFTVLGDWEIIVNYTGNVSVPLVRQSVTSDVEWESPDDDSIYYNLWYTDENGTIYWYGYINEEDLFRIDITYTNNQTLTVWLGDMEDRFEDNEPWDLEESGIVFEGSAPMNFSVIAAHPGLREDNRFGMRYNARLVYAQDEGQRSGYPFRPG